MKFVVACAVEFGLGLGCSMAVAAARLPGPAMPQFNNAAQVLGACDKGLADARTRVRSLESRPPGAGWLGAFDDAEGSIEDASSPISMLANLHPNPAVRRAAEACELRWQDFNSSRAQSDKLYRALRAVEPLDPIDRELQRTSLEGFEDAGIGLPADQRKRAKQINDRIGELTQKFDRNIRDSNVTLAFSDADLRGVPPALLKAARRNAQGRALLGIDAPTYVQVMQNAENGATRERMWRAKTNEGGQDNLVLLAEIARLRHEYAALFGSASYADFVLRRRMAENSANTERFLGEVRTALTEREQKDIGDLRETKARHLAQPLDATTLQRWDVVFYTERLKRERYSVDQEAFRPYFPPEQSLQFTLRLVEKMMGVRYTRVPAKLWHPSVQAYAVSDAAGGRELATLYVDLYPRPGKYNHAAVFGLRSGSTRSDRAPQAALVVNFDRNGLTLDELETLLHELGHAVHNNLSSTRYASQAGTSVQRDFVEAPSQMLEDWVYDRRVLDVFKEVCPSCKPVPDDLLKKAVAAREADKGVHYARQHLYASYDLALHGVEIAEPMALWARMEGATPLGHVPGTMFPAGFAHAAGGYAAGYYGYLWSLVVAMDLRTAFNKDKLDPVVGLHYRNIVLGNGSQRPPKTLIKDFLGRDTNPAAFFEFLRR